MKIWAKTKEYSEGKYLVVRRDGTLPNWPHFVLGGDDPSAPFALRAYADDAEKRGLDPEYVESVRELSDDFAKRKGGKADPDSGPHRKDHPAVIAMMRREKDLLQFLGDGSEEVKTKVCNEILAIVAEYDEQAQSKYGVDTPGGLEHMGDVWELLRRWGDELKAKQPKLV